MNARLRIVVDTNALISRLLLTDSVAARAVRKAVDEGQLLASEATMTELAEVLSRGKFDPYVSIQERREFVRLLGGIVELVPIIAEVRACRDPKDDKFLDVAVNGNADLILTGDRDLLALHPSRGIPIRTPAQYLTGARSHGRTEGAGRGELRPKTGGRRGGIMARSVHPLAPPLRTFGIRH